MIETALYFVLGFLCAALLALLVAPAIWRRAVALTRRRVEASIPLTLDEIKADKDSLRAEFAMTVRRLEMDVKTFKDKNAVQMIEIDRQGEELKVLARQSNDKSQHITDLENRIENLTGQLAEAAKQHEIDLEQVRRAQSELHDRTEELRQIERLYEETSLLSSSRQIELVANESQLEKLSGDISAMRRDRKEVERRVRELLAETKTLHQALRDEKKKTESLQGKMESSFAAMSDMEERLGRRDRDIARLRTQINEMTSHGNAPEDAADDLRSAAINELLADRDRLEDRLQKVLEQNRQLRSANSANATDGQQHDIDRENAMLREDILDLAAQVANMTAVLEGDDSPIKEILSELPADADTDREGRPVPLAERIRSLQKRAEARRSAI